MDKAHRLTMSAAMNVGGGGEDSNRSSSILSSGTNANVFEILERLPADALDKLYGKGVVTAKGMTSNHGQWTCRAILQSLPQLAKQHVMRLLFVEEYVEKGMLKSWVKKEYHRVHSTSIRRLVSLRVLLQKNDGQEYLLNPPFRESLQRALCASDKTPWQGDVPLVPDRSPPSIAKIEQKMHSQWQDVLYFLVGSDEEGRSIPPVRVVRFMQESGLMRSTRGGALRITDKGYAFMLKETHVQAWMVVDALINGYERTQRGCREELLAFLFQLSYCKVGDDYPLGALTKKQAGLAQDLVDLGLLFKRKAKSSRFYPTSIAVNLMFGSSNAGGTRTPQQIASGAAGTNASKREQETSIQIIVETNFQVIAYTRSKLHFAMLSLFLELRARLPNAIVGAITRESMRRALATGIKGRQVLDFLKWHAHPVVQRRIPVVPENIADQILLWERERDRIVPTESVLVDLTRGTEFVFAETVGFASRAGGCLWHSPLSKDPHAVDGAAVAGAGGFGRPNDFRQKMLVVTQEVASRVSAFVEERM